MADVGLEERGALAYVAFPMTLDVSELSHRVQEGYRELDLYLGERELEERGPAIIRYRRGSEVGSMDIEVGWLMERVPLASEPFMLGILPAGRYVVAWHDGPYSRIGDTTREAIRWAATQAARFDITPDPAGDLWACWYEIYLAEPMFGPEGPAGSVEVCLKVADA